MMDQSHSMAQELFDPGEKKLLQLDDEHWKCFFTDKTGPSERKEENRTCAVLEPSSYFSNPINYQDMFSKALNGY